MSFHSLGCTRHTADAPLVRRVVISGCGEHSFKGQDSDRNTELQNAASSGNKTSKMIGNEVRVFQMHEGKFFCRLDL